MEQLPQDIFIEQQHCLWERLTAPLPAAQYPDRLMSYDARDVAATEAPGSPAGVWINTFER